MKMIGSAGRVANATGGGGVLSLLGVSGCALEWKHGWGVVSSPFAGCNSLTDVGAVIQSLDDASFLGIILFAAILLASTLSLGVGVHRYARQLAALARCTSLGRRIFKRPVRLCSVAAVYEQRHNLSVTKRLKTPQKKLVELGTDRRNIYRFK